MSITRATLASVEALAAWMQTNAVPNIFKSVTYENSILTATDADDNVALEIKAGTATNNQGYLKAYRASGNSVDIQIMKFPHQGTNIDIIGCDNGFIVGCDVTIYNSGSGMTLQRAFAFLCSNTNNDEPAVVFPAQTSSTANAQYTTGLQHVAFGDSATMSTTTTFTPETAQQTTLCPFGTNADVGTASYTTDAYYMPMGQNYNSGMAQFSIGNDHFITNGYWAIRTGGDE